MLFLSARAALTWNYIQTKAAQTYACTLSIQLIKFSHVPLPHERERERLSIMLTTKPTETVREERNKSKSTGQMMGRSAV